MTSYEIGDMFWGKSQSYPWWPCVIMTNKSNEIKRSRKKTGTQYHVQFIGPNYDACWITNNFLIKYDGTQNFESYVEQQLRSSLPPQHKLMFEMKMTGQIQAMWIRACQDAEKIHQLSNEERTTFLPKACNSTMVVGKKSKIKRQVSKPVSKMSDCSSVTDTVSIDTKCMDSEDIPNKESLSAEVEEICRKVYIAEETENRLKNSTESINQTDLEKLIKEQWSVLDIETKLLYYDGSGINMSKSRVSGRKIKVPSRLRRTNDFAENMKKTALKKRSSETTPVDKKRNSSSEIFVNIPTMNFDESPVVNCDLTPSSLQLNSIYREAIDSEVLKSLTIQESSMEIVKLIADKHLPTIAHLCHQCLKPFKPNENYKTCKGDCQSSFHFMCAMNHKLFRYDDNTKCVNCLPREFLCCICKNSKYMKKQFLVKCTKSDCPFHFHATCLKFLNFIETVSDEKIPLMCPNHGCLTCFREDNKHPCNSLGSLVSCTKCPISYHDNMLCIPAGCRIMSDKTIICHRHFESSIVSLNPLTRCFECFHDNATLRCCRCRAVFHPKCMNMPTYTDLLKDYVCSTCKLEQPLFYGQTVWTEIDNLWTPAEIIFHTHVPDDIVNQSEKSLIIRIIENGEYRHVDPCELISFVIGESVLQGRIITKEDVLECAKRMHIVYLNWRKRMRPYQSKKFPIIGQSELLKLSVASVSKIQPVTTPYSVIVKNRIGENIKNLFPKKITTKCSCSENNYLCDDDYCYNYVNRIECQDDICSNSLCNNRKFASGFSVKPIVTDVDVINGSGVKIMDNLSKDDLIAECTGNIISADTAFDLMNQHNNLKSDYFIFQLRDNFFLDCQKQGNEWRHLNHSCNPNAELVCFYVSGELRLGVSLLRSISNEEVTINYQKCGLVLKYDFKCNCQSSNCTKAIGPTSIFANQTNLIVPRCCIDNKIIDESAIKQCSHATVEPSEMLIVQPSVKVVNSLKSEHIDIDKRDKMVCHRCDGFGELIICNKANCQKRYHLQCVELSIVPKGLWYCPKHYCVECGQAATIFCNHCSTSHCKSHSKLQKRHNCRDYVEPAKSSSKPIIIQSNNDDCDIIDPCPVPNVILTKASSVKKEIVKNDVVIDNIKSNPSIIPKEGLFEKVTRSMNSNQMSLFINKKDLYSSCDLEPIITGNSESDLSANSNSNSPNQVNLTIKRPSVLIDVQDKVKKPRLSRNICNISNYQSTDEEIEPIPEPIDDSTDIRCQIVPMGIEDMENLIISPMVLDD